MLVEWMNEQIDEKKQTKLKRWYGSKDFCNQIFSKVFITIVM